MRGGNCNAADKTDIQNQNTTIRVVIVNVAFMKSFLLKDLNQVSGIYRLISICLRTIADEKVTENNKRL